LVDRLSKALSDFFLAKYQGGAGNVAHFGRGDDDLEARARRLLASPGNKRVEIMVSGPLARLGTVRQSLDQVQRQLVDEARNGGGRLHLRVTAFLDGCRHTTPWSNSPVDAGAATTEWHCFQGQTLFAEAFEHSAAERERIDAVIIFGDRFDDGLRGTLKAARRLRDRGTKIFAFHVGNDHDVRAAYDQLAASNGGVSVQLSSDAAVARVLPVITDYLFRPAQALAALPTSKDADIRALVDQLKLQPVAAAPRVPPAPVAGMLPPPLQRVPVKR
jgi:hypothetical protein